MHILNRHNWGLMGLAAAIVSLTVCISACTPQENRLERVLDKGELTVLTRNSATTYYEDRHGPAGLEYDLLVRFADHLGVSLNIQIPDNLEALFDRLHSGQADLAAAGLTVTEERRQQVRFGPTYQQITQQLIYNSSGDRPREVGDLDGYLEVVANSSHAEALDDLRREHTALQWVENERVDTSELLSLLAEGLIDYTIADSNEFAAMRRYYPELRVAFDVSEPQPLAWAFARDEDDSLYLEAVAFFRQLKESGELARLIKHNYEHIQNYDYAGTRTFIKNVRRRLPEYRQQFETVAAQYDMDWRLLAAVAYQESHWDPDAVSPTGVRGIMMLTRATARHLGIEKRADPVQSIQGGAKYLARLRDKIPQRIGEPDRTWFTLAAYNVGYGHLEDARIITERRGGDPDKWVDVKQNLPLLTRKKWYRTTKHGYARGYEPVRYVENIRSYYDVLSWYLEQEQPDPAHKTPRPVLAFTSHAL